MIVIYIYIYIYIYFLSYDKLLFLSSHFETNKSNMAGGGFGCMEFAPEEEDASIRERIEIEGNFFYFSFSFGFHVLTC